MEPKELVRLIEGLQSAGFPAEKILNQLMYIASGEEQYKQKQ